MNRLGHLGISLAFAAPFLAGALLVGRPVAGAVIAVALVLSEPLPDIDQKLTRIVGFVKHRGMIHSVFFVPIVAGAFVAFVAGVWTTAPLLSSLYPVRLDVLLFVAVGATLGPLSHFLGDIITPRGLRPFAPVSSRKFAAGWTTANNPVANGGLLAVGLVGAALAVTVPVLL